MGDSAYQIYHTEVVASSETLRIAHLVPGHFEPLDGCRVIRADKGRSAKLQKTIDAFTEDAREALEFDMTRVHITNQFNLWLEVCACVTFPDTQHTVYRRREIWIGSLVENNRVLRYEWDHDQVLHDNNRVVCTGFEVIQNAAEDLWTLEQKRRQVETSIVYSLRDAVKEVSVREGVAA